MKEKLKIQFLIDVERKRVAFFVKKGELKRWVEDALQSFPELSKEQIVDRSSNCLNETVLKTMAKVCEMNNISDWQNFKPSFVYN
jgi:hypothetical protein